jgi:sugar phosphate isomerase/epimerase
MRLSGSGAHLTYCTNIHPGESWAEVDANLRTHVLAVKRQICPDRPFGVGLRLSARAAGELARPETLEALRAFLDGHGLYVFTINGFPHGTFHGTAVKEQVYRPDWLEEERVAYSDRLADVLSHLLPSGPASEGSISTVPGGFRPRVEDRAEAVARNLLRHVATLWRLRERGGPTIALALEPEPECMLETTAHAVSFFEDQLFSSQGTAALSALTGLATPAAEECVRRHLGLCLDACHAAVEYEDAGAAVRTLRAAGIPILKLQVSAGLRVLDPDEHKRRALERFAEGVYLHQVVVRRGTALTRIVDLPQALRACDPSDAGDEWRIHFHVPLFQEDLGAFQNTRPFLAEILALQARDPFTQHLEVETYTWDVLPEEYRRQPVADAVARELRWALRHLGEGGAS